MDVVLRTTYANARGAPAAEAYRLLQLNPLRRSGSLDYDDKRAMDGPVVDLQNLLDRPSSGVIERGYRILRMTETLDLHRAGSVRLRRIGHSH